MQIVDAYWKMPVEITMQSGLRRKFSHAYDALDFLEAEWPTRRGPAYHRAKLWCARALELSHVASLARRAFIRAAQEAGMMAVRPQAKAS